MKRKFINWLIIFCMIAGVWGIVDFPISVQAATEITGGDTKDTAREIELNTGYEAAVPLTENEFGSYSGDCWYKVHLPEYTHYVGISSSEDLYSMNDLRLYNSLGEPMEQIYYEYYESSVKALHGQYGLQFYYVYPQDSYIYLKAHAENAETIPLYVVAGVNPQESDNVELQFNQTYTETFYISGEYFSINDVCSSNYFFTAPYTGKYRITCESKNGDIKGQINDYTGYSVKSFSCDRNDNENVYISLKAGMSYQLTLKGGMISSEKPTELSFYISDQTISSITVPENEITLEKAERYQIRPVVEPDTAVDTSVTYISSDKTVAKVTKKGVITAVGPGTAVISIESNDGSGKYAEIEVTVNPTKVTRIKLSATKIVLSKNTGKSVKIKAKVYPDNADNKKVTYKSSNPKVVAVDKNTGKLKPKKAGTVTITCTSSDGSKVKSSCKVVVKKSYFKK